MGDDDDMEFMFFLPDGIADDTSSSQQNHRQGGGSGLLGSKLLGELDPTPGGRRGSTNHALGGMPPVQPSGGIQPTGGSSLFSTPFGGPSASPFGGPSGGGIFDQLRSGVGPIGPSRTDSHASNFVGTIGSASRHDGGMPMGNVGMGAGAVRSGVGMMGSSHGVRMNTEPSSILSSVGMGGKMVDGTDPNAAPFIPASSTLSHSNNIPHGASGQRGYDGIGSLTQRGPASDNQRSLGAMDMASSMFYNNNFASRDDAIQINSSPMPPRGYSEQSMHQEALNERNNVGGRSGKPKSIGNRVNERLAAQQVAAQGGGAGGMMPRHNVGQQQHNHGGGGNDMMERGEGHNPARQPMPDLLSPSKLAAAAGRDPHTFLAQSSHGMQQPNNGHKQPNSQHGNHGGYNNTSGSGNQLRDRERPYHPPMNHSAAAGYGKQYRDSDRDEFRKQKSGPASKSGRTDRDKEVAERERQERQKRERELQREKEKREREQRGQREREQRERQKEKERVEKEKKAKEVEEKREREREKKARKERARLSEESRELTKDTSKKAPSAVEKDDVSGGSKHGSTDTALPTATKKFNKKTASPSVSNESMKLFDNQKASEIVSDESQTSTKVSQKVAGSGHSTQDDIVRDQGPSKQGTCSSEDGAADKAIDTKEADLLGATAVGTHAYSTKGLLSSLSWSLQAFIAKRLGPRLEHHINWLLVVHPLVILSTMLSHVTSLVIVLFSLVLVISLSFLSVVLRMHESALFAFSMNRHIACSFIFLFSFPHLVNFVIPWAPTWAPVCLWYAFLVQLFCISGPKSLVSAFRLLLPLSLLMEGVSHHSFLLDLNGGELLLISFALSALKTCNVYNPLFFMSFAFQTLSAVFGGTHFVIQWCQLVFALCSLFGMVEIDSWYDQNGEMTRKYHAKLARAGRGSSLESGIHFGLSQGGDYNGIPSTFDTNSLHYVNGSNWGTTSNSSSGSDSGWIQNERGNSRPPMSSRNAGYRRRR